MGRKRGKEIAMAMDDGFLPDLEYMLSDANRNKMKADRRRWLSDVYENYKKKAAEGKHVQQMHLLSDAEVAALSFAAEAGRSADVRSKFWAEVALATAARAKAHLADTLAELAEASAAVEKAKEALDMQDALMMAMLAEVAPAFEKVEAWMAVESKKRKTPEAAQPVDAKAELEKSEAAKPSNKRKTINAAQAIGAETAKVSMKRRQSMRLRGLGPSFTQQM